MFKFKFVCIYAAVLCGVASLTQAQCCGKNAFFTKCGSACPMNCSNAFDSPRPCIEICLVDVCQCVNSSYVFKDGVSGDCILKEDCPNAPKCSCNCEKLNAECTNCGTACPRSCADLLSGPKMCTLQCIANVCRCKEGYVLEHANSDKCIREVDCPKTASPSTVSD